MNGLIFGENIIKLGDGINITTDIHENGFVPFSCGVVRIFHNPRSSSTSILRFGKGERVKGDADKSSNLCCTSTAIGGTVNVVEFMVQQYGKYWAVYTSNVDNWTATFYPLQLA